MILQTLDVENKCKGVFWKGNLHYRDLDEITQNAKIAWRHSEILKEDDYKYLYVMSKGEDLSKFSPNPETYRENLKKIESHRAAAITAKVDLSQQCFFDLIPDHQVHKYFYARDQALELFNQQHVQGSDYEILHKAHVLTSNIGRQDIIFDNRIGRVIYNIFGSVTGRLTTHKRSVPVLTLKKDQRKMIRPNNDVFIELDLNAAEVRMLMALSGREQPQQDIHEWVVENVFSGEISRPKAKVELFAWLYNPSNSKSHFDQFFSRTIFRDFFDPESQSLTTPFGRELQVDERRAQNYLLQSTTSDQVLENAYEIQKMLKNHQSKIAFTLHDSIILDMSKKDAIMLREIKQKFENTRWGVFPSTCKIGKTFGDLKELKI